MWPNSRLIFAYEYTFFCVLALKYFKRRHVCAIFLFIFSRLNYVFAGRHFKTSFFPSDIIVILHKLSISAHSIPVHIDQNDLSLSNHVFQLLKAVTSTKK